MWSRLSLRFKSQMDIQNIKKIVTVLQQVACGLIMLQGFCCIKRKTWIKAKKEVTGVNCGRTTHPCSCGIFEKWEIILRMGRNCHTIVLFLSEPMYLKTSKNHLSYEDLKQKTIWLNIHTQLKISFQWFKIY